MSIPFDGEMADNDRVTRAFEILDSIRQMTVPSASALRGLYGDQKLDILQRNIAAFMELNRGMFGLPRQLSGNAPKKVVLTRDCIEKEQAFQEVQSSLLFGRIPAMEHMEVMYGGYAGAVIKLYKVCSTLGLKRHCGLPSVAHMNRVGAIVHYLPMDDPGSFTYAAAAAMHDGIEDLLNRAEHPDGKVHGIGRYREFIDTYIPAELQDKVKALTNHFDLLISHVEGQLRAERLFVDQENFKTVVAKTYEGNNMDLHPYIEAMYYRLDHTKVAEPVIDEVKWLFYKESYLKHLARNAHNSSDYRIYEIKGIDLSDNGLGRGALSLSSRIKNIIKHQAWIDNMRRLKPTWPPIIEMMDELQAEIIRDAEIMIVRDLIERQSSQDFLLSALLKLRKLKTVFYES